MIDMNDFRYFVTIVDRGGFTSAGQALGLPTSTLSYRIKQLEERLGLVLLLRTSRRLSLTEAGNEFYRHALATVENANEAEHAMRTRLSDPAGTLRYTTAPVVAQFIMPPIVNSFMSRYPKVTLVQHVANHCVDIVGERFDLAIRVHRAAVQNSNFIQTTLASIPWYLFASPAYLKRYGEVETPQDLATHQMLLFSKDSSQPRLTLSHQLTGQREEIAVAPRLLSSCMTSLKDAAKAGIGITALPAYLCGAETRSGDLAMVLPGWLADDTRLTALMPYRVGLSAAVSAFIDHLATSCQDVINNCPLPDAMASAA
ncbi:LysR family transcriptional regulator [Rhizobium sp. P38BS-XIX]|uniref:LysR substrate-binding domain-containing protein n=1 Tax=Rhizobium sp. P38BS-XIX TaxID=2726740 RepID=UPI00145725F7|nr:LysR substrate-binding domain-containing protein [Rhizobium sp. P38BS-XIX]NLS01502.1 LysR family transcriptional regulator [Rhizobium sp. P38BS-XIX]